MRVCYGICLLILESGDIECGSAFAGKAIRDDFGKLSAQCVVGVRYVSFAFHVHELWQVQEVVADGIDGFVVVVGLIPIPIVIVVYCLFGGGVVMKVFQRTSGIVRGVGHRHQFVAGVAIEVCIGER